MKKFSKEHEWIEISDSACTVGITDYAQQQLGDIVYIALTKEIGDQVSHGDDVAEIESVKSVSQVYSPVSGKIAEFNEVFEDESQSALVNEDPYGKGWIFKIEISDKSELDQLMTEDEYNKFIETL